MVNIYNNDELGDDLEVTNEDTDTTDTELVDEEATAEQKLKALRNKLAATQDELRDLREAGQREKADFLNARKRLEDERLLDRKRALVGHIERLLPLADSFYLARYDKAAWEAGDEKWRKGVEGIHQQLLGILRGYGVEAFDAVGATFDPIRHEAMSSVTVGDKSEHDKVVSVLQQGYELFDGEERVVIRPARVTVGEYAETQA
jgi:molecular chaperone GrpE